MYNGIFKNFTMKKDREELLRENLDPDSNKGNHRIPRTIIAVKEKLAEDFSNCSDLIIREFEIGRLKDKVILVFIDGFVDRHILSQNVIDPILKYAGDSRKSTAGELLRTSIISSSSLFEVVTYEACIDAIASGDAVIFINGENTALRIGVKFPDKRPVQESDMEITIKGSREGFTECLLTNTILLRRRIKNPQFKVETYTLGHETKSSFSICYIEGIVKHEIVEEVKRRIRRINIDAVIGSGYIEQFIQDGKFPLFPMVGNSEKPDKVVGKLLEGRVAILVDGTPTVLTVPFLFIETIQSQEDYFGEYYFATFIRILRFVSFKSTGCKGAKGTKYGIPKDLLLHK